MPFPLQDATSTVRRRIGKAASSDLGCRSPVDLINLGKRDRSSQLRQIGARLHVVWRRRAMADAEVGWIAAIIIGGIAGWLAEQFMKSDMGLLMNIVLGIVGAAIASAILSVFGIALGGWIGYLVLGFIGACLLIWIVRMVRSRA
jgi:uncharacterized membrane protein YeaQ/YmgE (transglycosylase-associated protein family)